MRPRCLVGALLVASLLGSCAAIRWLALNQAEGEWNESSHCPQNKEERKKFGLVGFQWKGCSDNVLYGERVSIEWADAPWRKQKARRRRIRFNSKRPHFFNDISQITMEEFMRGSGMTPRSKMNQHNNDVGRSIVRQSLTKKCKCHGVSSSCSLKTCWQVLPDLNEIGLRLQEKYGRATEVRATRRGGRTSGGPPAPDDADAAEEEDEDVRFQAVALMNTVTDDDLVYIRKSPDYCTADQRVGSFGTGGRSCNASASSHASCDSMCCGRGFVTVDEEIEETCHCKYVHCCYVKCKRCRYVVQKHFCK